MSREETYSYIMSMLEENCPVVEEEMIRYNKNQYDYYIGTDPSVTTLQIIIKKKLENSILVSKANAITNKLNSEIPFTCYLVDNGTFVYRRVVPLAVLSTRQDLSLFLEDLEIKSSLGYERLIRSQNCNEDPEVQEFELLINPFPKKTTHNEN